MLLECSSTLCLEGFLQILIRVTDDVNTWKSLKISSVGERVCWYANDYPSTGQCFQRSVKGARGEAEYICVGYEDEAGYGPMCTQISIVIVTIAPNEPHLRRPP